MPIPVPPRYLSIFSSLSYMVDAELAESARYMLDSDCVRTAESVRSELPPDMRVIADTLLHYESYHRMLRKTLLEYARLQVELPPVFLRGLGRIEQAPISEKRRHIIRARTWISGSVGITIAGALAKHILIDLSPQDILDADAPSFHFI